MCICIKRKELFARGSSCSIFFFFCGESSCSRPHRDSFFFFFSSFILAHHHPPDLFAHPFKLFTHPFELFKVPSGSRPQTVPTLISIFGALLASRWRFSNSASVSLVKCMYFSRMYKLKFCFVCAIFCMSSFDGCEHVILI